MLTKIIAELCYNHQGDIETAKKMIDKCSDLGIWAVKLQKWDVDSFPPEIKSKKRDDEHAFGKTYYEHRKALELDIDELLELKDYAESKGLVFICSGKELSSVKLLVNKGIKYIKLPSQRYFDNDIFNYLVDNKKNGIKIMVSTGMCHENELSNSSWIRFADVVMHCVSLYPVPQENCDLSMIRKYPFINGYSCHDEGGDSIKYAVAMGCEYIERHFTLDKDMKGTDHSLSSDSYEMERIIEEIELAELMCGERKMTHKELENRQYYRSF